MEDSVEIQGTPTYITDRFYAERKCGVGRCGQSFWERNMRILQKPDYGVPLDGVEYKINRIPPKGEKKSNHPAPDSKLFRLQCNIEEIGRTIITVEILYELYPTLVKDKTQQGGYIYLRDIEKKIVNREDASKPIYRHIAMKILCSEVAWLLYNNYIKIYWDILLLPSARNRKNGNDNDSLISYYNNYGFEPVTGNYNFIPELEGVGGIMIVNISRFIEKCKYKSVDMGAY